MKIPEEISVCKLCFCFLSVGSKRDPWGIGFSKKWGQGEVGTYKEEYLPVILINNSIQLYSKALVPLIMQKCSINWGLKCKINNF